MKREDILDHSVVLVDEDDTEEELTVVDLIDHEGRQYAILQADEPENPFEVTVMLVEETAGADEPDFEWVEDADTRVAVFRKYAAAVQAQQQARMEQARDWFFAKYGDAPDGE